MVIKNSKFTVKLQGREGFLGSGRGEISSAEENEPCQQEGREIWQMAGPE
jgi:hypothetical protein